MPTIFNLSKYVFINLANIWITARLIGPHPLKRGRVTRIPNITVNAELIPNFLPGEHLFVLLAYQYRHCPHDLLRDSHRVALLSVQLLWHEKRHRYREQARL